MKNGSKAVNGFVAWQGASKLDGSPIVCIVTGIDKARKQTTRKANKKTGAMAQLYILRSDCSPVEARKTGADVSICGDCLHRKGSCYVRVEQGPLIVYKAFLAGKYPALSLADGARALAGLPVRIGAYGDAGALPSDLLPVLLKDAGGFTGYTHQWKRHDMAHLAHYCMASCDTMEEQGQATAQGWRTFTIVPKGSLEHPPKSFLCPASDEAGKKLTCNDCLACNGNATGRGASVFIPVHGVNHKQARFASLIQIGRA